VVPSAVGHHPALNRAGSFRLDLPANSVHVSFLVRTLQYTSAGFSSRLQSTCRGAQVSPQVVRSVAAILDTVRSEGDPAVVRWAARFDGARLTPRQFRVSATELAAARSRLPQADLAALRDAHRAIRQFNSRSLPADRTATNPQGARVGEKFDPIRRVGLYIPGGQVPLVSTVLMTATLARIAGCPEVVACTPSGRDGKIADGLLVALQLAGVREIYRIGGVQAIGAFAYGTRTIPAVDKIFGPGNAYVCEAKRQVFGTVGVDSLPGPSELMVIADESARPDFAAADLLAQAEHGSGREKIFLVATSAAIIAAIDREMRAQSATLPRSAQARRVMTDGFVAIVVPNLDAAAEVANYVAPEHLELMVRPAGIRLLTRKIVTAGAIMAGVQTATALGDFVAGPSHVLPTGRTGRFFSGLRVEDFMRRTSLVRYDRKAVRRAAPAVAAFARMEQLEAHGRSVELRCR